MIQAVNLTKGFGEQILFSEVGFTLGKGERVGLVGRNGTGKTTLFKIILGEESPDGGEIVIPKNYRLGALKQHLYFTEDSILAECMTALRGDAIFDQYKVEKMLMGLGFKESDFTRPPSDFSGGYQIRLNLAKVLLEEPDCLLLDEPTNYLDIVSLRWLKRFLVTFPGEVVIITHDRGFMDDVTTHTMGIWRQKLVKNKGNTEKYYEQIILEEEIHEKTRVNTERKRKELEDFVARFKAKASKATQAQSRMKMLEKMTKVDALSAVAVMDFEFSHKECPGKVLKEIKDVTFGYPDSVNLFEGVNFPILKNDKIAIIGKNGRGKSTLLNLLASELQPKSGSISSNVNLIAGHFGQTNINRLDMNLTIEQEISSVDAAIGQMRVRSICGTMMFSGELAEKKIKVLSGGERARVLLGKLLAKPTNLLLLDEPTNHLDQESIESLMIELQNYEGAVVIVTHSENIIRNVATKLIAFHHGRVDFLDMGYDEFLSKYGWEEEESEAPKAAPKFSRADQKRLRSEMILERSRELSPLKKRMEVLEKDIIVLEKEQAELEAKMIDLAAGGDSKKIQESSLRLGVVKKRVDDSFEELTEITMKHDELFQKFEVKLKEIES